MKDLKDKNDNLLSDDKRLTTFGEFLRTFSLDELPQIVNVLIGDMSFIGPRPLLVEYLALYNSEQARRHEVRPGITGWAQIKGRNSITWTEKFKYDIWYIDNITFTLDFYIGIKTFLKIIGHKDISYEHEATMHYFDGSN